MKILYYCPEYYSRHGGRAHARGFYHALENLPVVSRCFLYPGSDPRPDPAPDEPKTRAGGRLWFLPSTPRRIIRFFMPRRRLARILIDAIKANDCDAVVIRTGVSLPSIKDIKKACPEVQVCLEINAAHFDESFTRLPLRSVFQKWEVMLFNRADTLVVVSSYLKEYLQARAVCPEKILVNQNGVDATAVSLSGVDDRREQYGIPEDAFVIGYIGGMERFRRLPEVVTYIAEMWRAGNKDIRLLIVGDGVDRPAVQAAIQAEGDEFGHVVILAGWREHTEIPGFLKTFDLAIFPFTNDYCSPLKLFEYLGAGVPTIGPDTSAVREVFEDGVHLGLVNQDGSNFVNTILELKNNPRLRTSLGQKGQALVLNDYTWEKNAERVVSHITNNMNGSCMAYRENESTSG